MITMFFINRPMALKNPDNSSTANAVNLFVKVCEKNTGAYL